MAYTKLKKMMKQLKQIANEGDECLEKLERLHRDEGSDYWTLVEVCGNIRDIIDYYESKDN